MNPSKEQGAWLGRKLTPENGKFFYGLQRRMKSEHLYRVARPEYKFQGRCDITYANVPEIRRLRAMTGSQGLLLSDWAIVKAIRRELPKTKNESMSPRVEDIKIVDIKERHAQHPYIVGIALESTGLNRELMVTDRVLSDMAGVTLEREYQPRILPFGRFHERDEAKKATQWLGRLLPLTLDLTSVRCEHEHLIQPDNYSDSIISKTFAIAGQMPR